MDVRVQGKVKPIILIAQGSVGTKRDGERHQIERVQPEQVSEVMSEM